MGGLGVPYTAQAGAGLGPTVRLPALWTHWPSGLQGWEVIDQ